MLTQEIAEKIRNKRKALNIDQQTVCDYTGLSMNTVSSIEKGKANPTLKTLLRICGFLGLEMHIS